MTRGLLVAASLLGLSQTTARAATVEAETLTTIVVEAPLFDQNVAADGGCNPAGCVGGNTRVSRAPLLYSSVVVPTAAAAIEMVCILYIQHPDRR